jgi:mannonate dehydratase
MTDIDGAARLAPWDGDEGSGVRITAVRAIVTAPEGLNLVIVKIITSDDGLHGLGCATFTQRAKAVAVAVDEYLAPQLIGRDPADVTDIAASLHTSGYWRSGPVLNSALSGVDMALWDIKGKQAGMPVWQLLGGRCRTVVPAYAHATGRDPSEVEDDARRLLAEGYRHVRCQVGVSGSLTYGARSHGSGAWDPAAYMRAVPRLFEHLRGVLEDDVELLHDVHERLPATAALRLAKALEAYQLFFLEDLLAPEDLPWLRLVRAQSAIPIAIGELFTHPAEYVPLVREGLCDFLRCHISAIGGVTPARRLAAAADLVGIRTAWHGPGDVSPVGHAANLALDFACPNLGIQEQHTFSAATHEVFPGTPAVTGGHFRPSHAPGLGVDLDEQLAAKHEPVAPLKTDEWTAVRLPDGTAARP